ncbi:hypothetical protein BD324DRAFT_606867 [Kockovaella imperatae]|uniref:ubiquitinyl hydrolase 1 n=1 Tax=Kockovaella imperatae TaxID=4999 RepID=A0A1Y1UVM7_9TREE|nr:hypothetical protein BD324DRAFT_606867 [Kockovaella imperatae]ORX41285.1 hypothetical protein BD324DRAFT_606867 [Kockovaella imperatae]
MSVHSGVRVIPPGPPSPIPRSRGYNNLQSVAGPSNLRSQTSSNPNSPATSSRPPVTSPLTPSRKGKEVAATPSGSSISTPATSSQLKKAHEVEANGYLCPDDVDLTWPTRVANAKRAGAGLYNPSMACYANSTLQVVMHTPPVLRMVEDHATQVENSTCLQARKGFCSVCALYSMSRIHWQESRYAPKSIHSNLSHIKKGFSKNRQEDAHEFFRFLTDSLQATALAGYPKTLPEKIKHTTWVYRIWGGIVRSRVVCSRCKKPSDTFDHFLDLSLDVNKGGSAKLQSMLQGFVREERLEGDNKYKCDSCKSKANAVKFFKIAQTPPILTFHLKRFSVSYGHRGQPHANRYNGYIAFPEHLDMTPYMVDADSGRNRYRLFAVTCHHGNELRFGHYTSYVKSPNGKWYHADDEDMSPCAVDDVLRDRNAYLLSYIRVTDDSSWTERAPSQSPMTLTNGYCENGQDRTPLESKVLVQPSSSNSAARNMSPLHRKRDRSPSFHKNTPSPAAKRHFPPNNHPKVIPSALRPVAHQPRSPSEEPPALPSSQVDEQAEEDGNAKSIFAYQPVRNRESKSWAQMQGSTPSARHKGSHKAKNHDKKRRGAPKPFFPSSLGGKGRR